MKALNGRLEFEPGISYKHHHPESSITLSVAEETAQPLKARLTAISLCDVFPMHSEEPLQCPRNNFQLLEVEKMVKPFSFGLGQICLFVEKTGFGEVKCLP